MRKSSFKLPAEGARVCSPTEAAAYLNISKATIYRVAAKGHLRFRKIGARSVIPVAELDAYLASLSQAA